jgi:hypothetical protein
MLCMDSVRVLPLDSDSVFGSSVSCANHGGNKEKRHKHGELGHWESIALVPAFSRQRLSVAPATGKRVHNGPALLPYLPFRRLPVTD